jgi:SAM-dependent MidA family methyltransferase
MPCDSQNEANFPAATLPEHWRCLLAQKTHDDGLIDYETFSKEALYHPRWGYYQQKRQRVGKNDGADFYTATCHTEIFPKLITCAIAHLCESEGIRADTWVEVGAEPGQSHWQGISMPCARQQSIPLRTKPDIQGSAIVYSNELLDAQPFQRWLARDGEWLPVSLCMEAGQLRECTARRSLSNSETAVRERLPPAPLIDYHLDLSLDAEKLTQTLCSQPWTGLWVAIDYGRSWENLIHETPQGTARAFREHRQIESLFDAPGTTDLTTDVCWDWIAGALEAQGFETPKLQSLSRFLMTHAQKAIEAIVSQPQSLLSKEKSQLLELLSPGFFGQRFQVMTAIRRKLP